MPVTHGDWVLAHCGEHAGWMVGRKQNEPTLRGQVGAALSARGLLQDELGTSHAHVRDAVENRHREEGGEVEDIVFETVRDHDDNTSG
jgi:hypothetical protein